jgi:23S rRNA pseudouridine2457 synthase
MPTLLFYKPYGMLSTFTDEGTGHPTLKACIPLPNVYAAGRLDRESEGLLLLTDDGDLIHRLTHPRYHLPKTYYVLVEGIPSEEALEKLRNGVVIRGYRTQPAEVRIIPEPSLPPRPKPVTPHGPTTWLEIRLREGKKRQIRHMTAAVGLPTLRLVRVAIGPLTLEGLEPGRWRYLTPDELRSLRALLAKAQPPSGSSRPEVAGAKAPSRPAKKGVKIRRSHGKAPTSGRLSRSQARKCRQPLPSGSQSIPRPGATPRR